MAVDMLQRRINDNVDREGWWLEIHDNGDSSARIEDDTDDKNESAVVDVPLEKKESRVWSDATDGKNENAIEDDDEEDDDNGTIYSRALLDPPVSHEMFSDASLLSSTLSVDSYVTAPCTYGSMISLAYVSFDWADDVGEAEAAGKIAGPTQPAPDTTTAYDAAEPLVASIQSSINASEEQLAFRESLAQHIHHAWSEYEKERQTKALENNRSLGWKPSRKHELYSCDWKWVPLYCSFEEHKEYALGRPATGRCAYECTPTIIVTNEDGEHFRLLEVRKVLTEEKIAEIRQARDLEQDAPRKRVQRYHIYNRAVLQGQTPTERLSVDRARAWWAVEQKKRDATYIDWEHDEANELALLKQQIEREVDLYFKAQALSEAKKRQQRYTQRAKAAQTEAFANLKLQLAEDALLPQRQGHYTSAAYSVRLTPRALNTFLTRRDDIEAMAFAIQSNARSAAGSEARKKRGQLRGFQGAGGLGWLAVEGRRETEIKRRYAHRKRRGWKVGGGEGRDGLVMDWLVDM